MSISVDWDNKQQSIVRLDFGADWTLAMLGDALTCAWEMIGAAGRKADVLLNFRDQRTFPEGAAPLVERMLAEAPALLGFVAIATRSTDIENAFTLLARVNRRVGGRIVLVPSVEGARSALAHPYTLLTTISPARLGNA